METMTKDLQEALEDSVMDEERVWRTGDNVAGKLRDELCIHGIKMNCNVVDLCPNNTISIHGRMGGMVPWGGTMKSRPDKNSGPTRYNLGKK